MISLYHVILSRGFRRPRVPPKFLRKDDIQMSKYFQSYTDVSDKNEEIKDLMEICDNLLLSQYLCGPEAIIHNTITVADRKLRYSINTTNNTPDTMAATIKVYTDNDEYYIQFCIELGFDNEYFDKELRSIDNYHVDIYLIYNSSDNTIVVPVDLDDNPQTEFLRLYVESIRLIAIQLRGRIAFTKRLCKFYASDLLKSIDRKE